MFGQRLYKVRKERNLTLEQLANIYNTKFDGGLSKGTLSKYENGKQEPMISTVGNLADILNVSVDYLLGIDYDNAPTITEDYTTFPVLGEIAAGYDHYAVEDWEGDTIDIPNSYLKGRPKTDYFVLRVTGDSMYPTYHDGDKVLILKQSTMNRSGEVGAVIYDDDIATLKKVEYVKGEDWMRLVPINPNVPPIYIENEALEHCYVLGVAKLLIREIS